MYENSPAAVWSTAARAERFVSSNALGFTRNGRCRQGPARRRPRIEFARINRAALARLPDILARWLPGGRIEGCEYVARNPTRHDHRPGSFKVNFVTGRWADFATGDKGGDPISLAAYLASCTQLDAARRLAAMLGAAADE